MKPDKKISTLAMFFAAYTITSFFKISANIVIPIFQERFAISSSFAGIISGMYYLPYAFLQLLAAPLSMKFGAKKVVATGFIVASAGSLLFAFANNAYMVMAGRFLVGVGVGPVFVSIVQFLTENYTGREFAMYTGLSVTFSGLGQVIASAPLKYLVETFSVKSVFIALSLMLLVVSSVLAGSASRDSNKINRKSERVFKKIALTCKAVVKEPVLLFVTLSWILYNSIQHSYQGLWSTRWMACAFPENLSLSGMSATLVSFGLMTGTFFSERLKPASMKRVTSTIRSEYLFALTAILVTFAHFVNIWVCSILDFLLGYFIGDICIQQTAYVRENSDDSISSSITGFMNFCSSLGTIVSQWFTGLSFDSMISRNIKPNNAYVFTFLIIALMNLMITIMCTSLQLKKQRTT